MIKYAASEWRTGNPKDGEEYLTATKEHGIYIFQIGLYLKGHWLYRNDIPNTPDFFAEIYYPKGKK